MAPATGSPASPAGTLSVPGFRSSRKRGDDVTALGEAVGEIKREQTAQFAALQATIERLAAEVGEIKKMAAATEEKAPSAVTAVLDVGPDAAQARASMPLPMPKRVNRKASSLVRTKDEAGEGYSRLHDEQSHAMTDAPASLPIFMIMRQTADSDPVKALFTLIGFLMLGCALLGSEQTVLRGLWRARCARVEGWGAMAWDMRWVWWRRVWWACPPRRAMPPHELCR